MRAAWEIVKLNRHKPKVATSVNSLDDFNKFFIWSVEEIVESLARDLEVASWRVDAEWPGGSRGPRPP